MLKIVAVGATAFFIVGTQLAYAQDRELEQATAADVETLTAARINIVKSALQLTPDQEKILARFRRGYARQGEQPRSPHRTH
jgi:hypothetical protein